MIENDLKLLNLIYRDSLKAKDIYKPSPYWLNQTKNSLIEIKKYGLNDFRSGNNGITASYGGSAKIDARNLYNVGIRKFFKWIVEEIPPFKNLFGTQVEYTKSYFNKWIYYFNNYLSQNLRVRELLERYDISFETTRGNCSKFFFYNNLKISHDYLFLLDTIDRINKVKPIKPTYSFIEIGGGFGINIHLLVELFKIRKIIFLDLAPNTYITTQYLKSFYGNKVKCYEKHRGHQIEFSNNSELEIYCILPHQIENIVSSIDYFHSGHTFVEIPIDVVKNYSNFINKFLKKSGFISLVSYGFNDTYHQKNIIEFFNGKVEKTNYHTINGIDTYNQYIIK